MSYPNLLHISVFLPQRCPSKSMLLQPTWSQLHHKTHDHESGVIFTSLGRGMSEDSLWKLWFITHPAPWWWGTNTGHRGTSDSVPAFSLFTQLCIKPYIFIVRASKLYKETLEYHYYTKRSFLLIGTPVSLAALSQGITRSRWSHNTRNTMPARQNPELWQIKIVKNLWHEAY